MNKTEIRQELKEVQDNRKRLQDREKALEALLATYGPGRSSNGNRPKQREYGEHRTHREREMQVLEFLRQHPDKQWRPREIFHTMEGVPDSSIRAAVKSLIANKQVTLIRDSPVTVQYKPTGLVAPRRPLGL